MLQVSLLPRASGFLTRYRPRVVADTTMESLGRVRRRVDFDRPRRRYRKPQRRAVSLHFREITPRYFSSPIRPAPSPADGNFTICANNIFCAPFSAAAATSPRRHEARSRSSAAAYDQVSMLEALSVSRTWLVAKYFLARRAVPRC